MSIVIRNGYAFPTNDLTTAFAHFHALRPKIAEIGQGIIASFYAREALNKIDAAAMRGEACEAPLGGLFFEILDRQKAIRAEGRRDPDVDLETSLTLIPTADRLLVVIFTEHDAIRDVLTEGLSALPWWNNTDHPEDLTKEDWDARGAMWTAAFSADPLYRPGACGVSMDFLPNIEAPQVDLILRKLISREKRAATILRAEIVQSFMEAGAGLYPAISRSTDPEILAQPDWVARKAEIEADLPEITEEILRNGYAPPENQMEMRP